MMYYYEVDEENLKRFGIHENCRKEPGCFVLRCQECRYGGSAKSKETCTKEFNCKFILKNGNENDFSRRVQLVIKGKHDHYGCVHLFPVTYEPSELPKAIADLKEKLNPFNTPMEESKLGQAVKAYLNKASEVSIAYVSEEHKTMRLPRRLLTKQFETCWYEDVRFGPRPEYNPLLCDGKMLFRRKLDYVCVDMIPIFSQPEYIIFWAGNRQLIVAFWHDKHICWHTLGTFVRLTETAKGRLLEITGFPHPLSCDYHNHLRYYEFNIENSLHYLGANLEWIARSPWYSGGFKINKRTGNFTVTGLKGDAIATYLFKDGHYQRK